MFKKSLLLSMVIVFALHADVDTDKKIDEYSFDSYMHIVKYTAVGSGVGAGFGAFLWWITPKYEFINHRYVLSADQNSIKPYIYISAILGTLIGGYWSSYYVKEECFNSSQSLLKAENTQILIDLLLSSDDCTEIMKRADIVYQCNSFPRLSMIRALCQLSKELISNYEYLKDVVKDEQALEEPNQYLIKNGLEYVDRLNQYIKIIAAKAPELKNDFVYLAQLSADNSAKAARAARDAQFQSMCNNMHYMNNCHWHHMNHHYMNHRY